MSLIALNNVSVSFGAADIFEDVSADAQPGDRIGLVGRNGAGKTTLLRVLAGVEPPTSGSRRLARAASVTLVEQRPPTSTVHTTVRQEALGALSHLLDLIAEMEQAAEAMAAGDAAASDRYAHLLERLESEGGFTYESQLSQVLLGLGLPEDEWDRPVSALSGGQRNRLALAKALLASPDILLMDEPTNHLDLRGLQWLEGFLNRWPGTVIVTSHDRYFLDAVATRIWHLDLGRLKAYPGNYSQFEELRVAELARRQKEYDAQQELIAKEQAFIRRYGAGQRAREAKGREKRLNRLERLQAPQHSRSTRLSFDASRSGDIVLTTDGLGAGYGERTVLRIPELALYRGERVALIGPNGAGKSTLLKTIGGELTSTAGSLRIGAAINAGHYWQEAENLEPNATVLEDLLRDSNLLLQPARDLLGRFLFSGDDVDKRVSMLSGGERSRLALAKLVLSRANLLLLDEPTNHLDIPAREALEDALESYRGTLVFASHDRRLIARLATRLWVIEDGALVSFEGTLEEYDAARAAVKAPEPATGRPRERPAISKNRERELQESIAGLEAAIEEQEASLEDLGTQIDAASERGDIEAVIELGARYEAVQLKLGRLVEDWTTLAS
jgi:ATP-binding cassette, subfamily F, member 3